MIKEIIIKCDDEQTKAHEIWLKEQKEIFNLIKYHINNTADSTLRADLVKISNFIKRGEM